MSEVVHRWWKTLATVLHHWRRGWPWVAGAPFQPGRLVRVVHAVDVDVMDVSDHIGKAGCVAFLEYACGCGQQYPDDPMIGVVLVDGTLEEFWREELALLGAS